MAAKIDIYSTIFDEAYNYLLSFDAVDEQMVAKHLNDWKGRKPRSLEVLLSAILKAIKNRRGMPKTIGKIEKLHPYLQSFNPHKILRKYDDDWRLLFKGIKRSYKSPGRMIINNPRSYWVIFCKSVISASIFLSRFSNEKQFSDFVSRFYLNEYTRVALPLLLSKEIYGLGFALACDFLKENGYPKFVKPDVHIIKIFNGIEISASESAYDVFKDVVRFAETIGQLPYRVDKLFWLVGSGKFYLNDVKIHTNRSEFIRMIRHKYSSKLLSK